jgi:hypothetical protein
MMIMMMMVMLMMMIMMMRVAKISVWLDPWVAGWASCWGFVLFVSGLVVGWMDWWDDTRQGWMVGHDQDLWDDTLVGMIGVLGVWQL